MGLSTWAFLLFLAHASGEEIHDQAISMEDDDVALMQVNLDVNHSDSSLISLRRSGKRQALHAGKEVTTTTRDPNSIPDTEMAKASQVSLNVAGDLDALVASLQVDIFMILFCFGFFMVAARHYPNIYAFRATGAWGQESMIDAPTTWDADKMEWFKWIKVSYGTTCEEMIRTCGLDAAFLIRFTVMAMEILAGVGIPNFLILSMLYCFAGGNYAGEDHLSYLGIGNVNPETHGWVFWPVAMMTWYNVIFIQYQLFRWQRYFIEHRESWLLAMPNPRDCTIMVEGIDDDKCSDAALTEFYSLMYGKSEIQEAFVVKKISKLQGLVEEYKSNDTYLSEAKHAIQKGKGDPFKVDQYSKRKRELVEEIKDEQRLVEAEAAKSPLESNIYATNGFVTFRTRRAAEQALQTRLRADDGSFVMSIPPDPSDVIWEDLQNPVAKAEFLQIIGWACVAGLFFMYMPIVLGISRLCSMDNLMKIKFMKGLLEEGGALESMKSTIEGQLGSLGLTFMTSMLPTFLMWIFNAFFYLKAHRWAQLLLQQYYFWFLIVFVLFTTSIGSSVFDTLEELAQSPFMIFGLLASKMPLTTHFYMNYVVMQWVTHAMNIMRYINLGKYFLFARLMDLERARACSEPEDQDYYGIGSRSARFSLMLVMGIVFGSICPLLGFFTFINFMLCRLIYGYLMPYAETRKADLGGEHWVKMLNHMHVGVIFYIILMTGILADRAATVGPCIISAISFLWASISYYKFKSKLHWENLPFEDVVLKGENQGKRKPTELSYRQPELDKDICEKVEIK